MKTPLWLATLSLVALAGCNKCDTSDPDGDCFELCPDGSEPDADGECPTDTDTDTGSGTATGVVSVSIIHYPADAQYPEEGTALGIATDEDGGIINLAECVLATGICLESLPAAGSSATADANADFIDTAEFLEAGEITAGSVDLLVNYDYGIPVYFGSFATMPTGSAGLSFGGDLAPYAGADDFTWPSAVVATSPDPLEYIGASAGQTIDFTWTPGTSGDMFLIAGGEVHGLNDSSGAFSYNIDDLGLEGPFDSGVVILRRWTTSQFDAAGSTASVNAVSDQWYYIEYEDLTGWTELGSTNLADSCTDAAAITAVTAGKYYGDLSDLTSKHDLGEDNPSTGYATIGRDGVVRIELAAGDTLTATAKQAAFDTAIFLLDPSTCDDTTLLAVADDTLDGGAEELTYTATGPETVHLVIDTWGAADLGGMFSLEIAID